MGEHDILDRTSEGELRSFMRALLEDVHALETMIEGGKFESKARRIGAEQEIFIVDRNERPAPRATELLGALNDPQFTTELGAFNIEANLSPVELGGHGLALMENELRGLLDKAECAARELGTHLVLVGILPTLAKRHLGLDYMTPKPRYLQLNRVMSELRGGEFRTLIKGLDELQVSHDNVMLEACNTSFQIHFQVAPDEFSHYYNLAQAVTAPVLAAGVNSPVLLQHRLWQESRVALFQQSLDTRSEAMTRRGNRQRVSFGDDWVRESVLEIIRQDVARYRVLISIPPDEPAAEVLARGDIPKLSALRLHNGTIYRWNRPCYGISSNGKPHLRIENRVLPAGPTVLDEIANAAFFFGLMCAVDEEYGDVTKVLEFDDAKANFMAAARYGLHARLKWIGGRSLDADVLVLDHLLPRAREGLAAQGTDAGDVDRYLGVIEERVRSGRTGSQWMLDSLSAMGQKGTPDERSTALVEAMSKHQQEGRPVHEWPLASLASGGERRDAYRTIGQMMKTDLFTVQAEDLVDLAASVMDWEHLHHIPVEDGDGHLVGLLTHRKVLRALARAVASGTELVPVREIMTTDVVTVRPGTPTTEAIELMRTKRVGCLPVVEEGNRLVGIVTEHDFIVLSARLLDRWLREE